MILIIILVTLFPCGILSIVIYSAVYGYMQNLNLEAQKNVLESYVAQWEYQFTGMERYAWKLLNDSKWLLVAMESGNSEYELAKTELYSEIQDRTSESIWSQADCINIYIKKTADMLDAYNGNNINCDEAAGLRKYTKEQTTHDWEICSILNDKYICIDYENDWFNIAIYVKCTTIEELWKSSSDYSIWVMEGREAERADKNNVEAEFMEDMSVVLKLPEAYGNQVMPVQVFLLFFTIIMNCIMIGVVYVELKKYLILPLEAMDHTIREISEGNKEKRLSGSGKTREMQELETSFNELMDKIYFLEIKNYETEIEKQKEQLASLQLQINPHLLLNTLNTIYSLSEMRDYSNIQKFTLNLVQYFRYSLKHMDELVTVGQEIDFVKSYVEVQKIRYPDSFFVLYDIEDEILSEKIPPLIIENFVENSVKYSQKNRETEIIVIVKKQDEYLRISICDNGRGIEREVLDKIESGEPYTKDGVTHIGIYNCIKRLKLFYENSAKFSVTSDVGEGTQIWIEIPCVKE